jgi:hypothetical protein
MSTEALQWFKSTYSGSEGGQCLEAAYTWRKSTHSGSEGGACLEVAHTGPEFGEVTAIHIRDSKNPDGPTFRTSPQAWSAFTVFVAR